MLMLIINIIKLIIKFQVYFYKLYKGFILFIFFSKTFYNILKQYKHIMINFFLLIKSIFLT